MSDAKASVRLTRRECDVLLAAVKDCAARNPDIVRGVNLSSVVSRLLPRKRILPSSAKAKGRNWQYKVAGDIADACGVEFSQDDEAEVSSRPMGQHGADIILRGRARRMFPWSVECKAQETVRLDDWVRQAMMNAGESPFVIAVHTKALPRDVAVLEWGDFLSLFRRARPPVEG